MSDKEKKKKSKEKKTEAVSAEPKVKAKALAKSDAATSEKAKTKKKDKEKAAKAKEAAAVKDPTAAEQTNGNYRPTHEQIAELAHSYYVSRGSQDGYHEQDWLRAEQELLVVYNS